jgi:hypothetical protein
MRNTKGTTTRTRTTYALRTPEFMTGLYCVFKYANNISGVWYS